MSEDTEQIRRETEAKWSGALNAIVKHIPSILAAVALGFSMFNGCKINNNVKWIGSHLNEKQTEIDQLNNQQKDK